jgi:hypothetical protein
MESDDINKQIQDMRDNANANTNIESVDSQSESNGKTSTININKQWNDANEELLVSIGENAVSYKWMHEKCSKIYNDRDFFASLILVLFGVFLSAKTILDKNSYILDLIRDVFTYCLTAGNIVNSFLKNQQSSILHKSISGKYAELYNDIRQLMTMYRKTRPTANNYINETLKLYDNYILESPDILNSVVREYKRVVDAGVSQPNVANRIQKIKITTERPLGNIFKETSDGIHSSKNINNRNNLQMMSRLNRMNDVTDLEANKMLVYEQTRFNNIVKDS